MNTPPSIRTPLLAVVVLICGCRAANDPWTQLPSLPQPMSNNAVALVAADSGPILLSMTGLKAGKTWRDVSKQGFILDLSLNPRQWHSLDVPGPPRLAASAVSIGTTVYLAGGYTVGEDHTEVSTPEIWSLDTTTGDWSERTTMPVPVDDSVVMVYADRYLILVSGWSNSTNVDNTQVYDTETDQWWQSTPFPGWPVFGHAGALSDDWMVICDGVRIEPLVEGRRFVPAVQCHEGLIADDRATTIEWRQIDHHGGPGLYRMAAGASDQRVIFAGGSPNPYNYNGVGYDGRLSLASERVFARSRLSSQWQLLDPLPAGSMDHRGLLISEGSMYVIGGMHDPQQVSAGVISGKVPAAN